MANVEHSVLTGSSLHEPKGVAAAAANRVYVSDGVGSGSWSTVSNSVLASTAKSFQAQLFHVQDYKTPGGVGGTFTAGGWVTRTLNTVLTNEISTADLNTDLCTFPAGTYWLEASAPAYLVGIHKVRWYNATDNVEALIGNNVTATSGGSVSTVRGRFTVASSKSFILQHYCTVTRVTDGLGQQQGVTGEVYAEVMVWKIS